MQVKWFSEPSEDYKEIVQSFYGPETGEVLWRMYSQQLAPKGAWEQRLSWIGLTLHDNNQTVAHVVIQFPLDRPIVYLGYLELIDSPEVAEVLLRTIIKKIPKQLAGKSVYYPVNKSIWHAYRFKSYGTEILPFEAPQLSSYASLFENLADDKEYYSSYKVSLPKTLKEISLDPAFSARTVRLKNLKDDLRIIYNLSVLIFKDEHSIPTFEEFYELYADVLKWINPNYVLIAEKDQKPVGFCFSFVKNRTIFLKTLGVLPEYQNQGVGGYLYQTIAKAAIEEGCDEIYYLTLKNDRLVTQLVSEEATKVAEYVLFKGKIP